MGACLIEDQTMQEWKWHGEPEAQEDVAGISAEMTIVTVVNTILNTTKVITELPPGHETNTAGTRVHTLTYTRSEQPLTTVL